MSIKTKLAGKAVKTTAKHTARGTTSKFRRDPLHTTTLLVLGCVVGVLAGWIAARGTAAKPKADFSYATPGPS